jgi:hypothetical protein
VWGGTHAKQGEKCAKSGMPTAAIVARCSSSLRRARPSSSLSLEVAVVFGTCQGFCSQRFPSLGRNHRPMHSLPVTTKPSGMRVRRPSKASQLGKKAVGVPRSWSSREAGCRARPACPRRRGAHLDRAYGQGGLPPEARQGLQQACGIKASGPNRKAHTIVRVVNDAPANRAKGRPSARPSEAWALGLRVSAAATPATLPKHRVHRPNGRMASPRQHAPPRTSYWISD